MSHSIYDADRATHLKIVVLGLVCATAVAAVAIAARVNDGDVTAAANGRVPAYSPVVKVGKPVVVTGEVPTIR